MSANALQALLALFKNRQQAMNPVWGDIEQRAYRRGYESALEKCIEDVVMQSEAAPPERKIVHITSPKYTSCVDNEGRAWQFVSGSGWVRMMALPQGEST